MAKLSMNESKLLEKIDYKNLDVLRAHIMETGRIIPSRITGCSARVQRAVAHHVKVARFLALIPYCDRHK